jgi:acyl carrier protein
LEYLGRKDFQVKIRGQRVHVGQVEQVLGEHPEVVRCAVMGHDSGSEEAALAAYYVAAPGTELTHNQLYGWLRGRLPGYMVPSAYVQMEQLPVLPNGKLDRRGLPKPEAGAYLSQGYESPQGETEQKIAEIWAETLELPVERIGRHDNFFAMGGQSLSAARVVTRLRHHFHIELPLRAAFESPTITSVAEQVSLLLKNVPDAQVLEKEIRAELANLTREQLQALLAQKRKAAEKRTQ